MRFQGRFFSICLGDWEPIRESYDYEGEKYKSQLLLGTAGTLSNGMAALRCNPNIMHPKHV